MWIHAPLSVIDRAIGALKERVAASNYLNKRQDAQEDDEAAEILKKSLREDTHDDKE